MFDGWTPQTVQQHFDADWNLTGYTITQAETEWDDATRERALRAAEFKRNKCPCGCGQQIEVAWNDEQVFSVEHYICYAGRAKAKIDRETAKDHEKSPEGWDDGRHTYVVPVDDPRPERKRKGRRR